MANTTVTFATVGNQADVEFVNDQSKPGWDDLLASDSRPVEQAATDEDVRSPDLHERASRQSSKER